MLKSLFLAAIRRIRKNVLFSFINIAGFAIGLAAALLVALWVIDELGYDRFHEHSHRMYRIERDMFLDGTQMQVPITSPPTAPQMAADYPVVEAFARVAREEVRIEDIRHNHNKEMLLYADSTFFQIFGFRLAEGDPQSCLTEPFTVAVSQTAAEAYLGENAAPGQVLRVSVGGQQRPFRVTAIFEDLPHNTHLQGDFIASFTTLNSLRHEMMMSSWMASFHFSYVLLSEGADPAALENQLQDMVDTHFGQDIRNLLNIDNPRDFLKILLVPVTDIHLHGNRAWEFEPPGNITSVRVFSLVALLLLVIAGINFMNLSTARASGRALEVGVRKASGASRAQLIRQFMGETLLFSFVGLLLAIVLIELAMPFFASFTGKNLHTGMVFTGWNLLMTLGAWLLTAFLAGIYPAFFLSSFRPAEVLKGRMGARGGQMFRKILVVGQFAISIGLIVCSVTVYRQIQFIHDKDLGFDRYGLIDLPVEDRTLFSSYEALRHDLLSLPAVSDVSRSWVIPTSQRYTDNPYLLRDNPEIFFPVVNGTDDRFIPVMGIRLLAGENFTPSMVTDSSHHYIINDAARKMFGFETPFDALGKEVGVLAGREGETANWGRILAVTEDFHFQPLTEPIKPMVMHASAAAHNHITLRVDPANMAETNSRIQAVWESYFPDRIFFSVFVSQAFDQQHLSERRLQGVLLVFTFLSILVACLGLLGLSAFSVERRTKEIGIRKVLGAGSGQIIRLITSEFSRLVLLANLIAIPAAYWIMRGWLDGFPYRMNLDVWVFLAAGATAWLTAFLTVLVNTWKTGRSNPVESLKYE
jgi:putative ABC transport system permease protein